MEAHSKEWLSGLSKPVSYELKPLSIHIIGDVANVFYVYKWHKEVVPGFHHGRAMDTYLMQDNMWMLIGGMDALCTKLPPFFGFDGLSAGHILGCNLYLHLPNIF